MAEFLPRVKGFAYFFSEPYIFIWLLSFLIFANLAFSGSLANLYSWMIGIIFFIYIILKLSGKHTLGINTSSGNTIQSIVSACLAWVVFIFFILLLSGVFSNFFSSVNPSFSTFTEQNANAFLGASKPILADSPKLNFFIFGIMIPIVETSLQAYFILFLCVIFGVALSGGRFDVLKNKYFWFINTLVTIGFTWLHVQAKGVTDLMPLLQVFVFFFVSGILIVTPIGERREAETAIWMHILNNSFSVLKTLRLI